MTLKHALLPLFCVALFACGGSDGPVDVGEGDDDEVDVPLDNGNGGQAPPPYNTLTWQVTEVERATSDRPAGDFGKLVTDRDGTMYYAYLRNEPSTSSDCRDLPLLSQTDAVPGLRYQLHVAVRPAGGQFGTTPERLPVENAPVAPPDPDAPTALTNFIGGRLGLDAAIDPANGNLLIATPGGGNGQFTCASSDLLFGRRTGANSYAMSTPATASDSCTGCPCTSDGACDEGTDVGYYPSIGIRNNGSIAVSYLDRHFVTDEDGKYADFEIVSITGGGGFEAIAPWSGAGFWGTLRYKGSFGFAVGSDLVSRGPQIFRKDGTEAWERVDFDVGQEAANSQVLLEEAPNGNLGLVYYQSRDRRGGSSNDLIYCESLDEDEGTNWICERPEPRAQIVAGAYPSLAFDADSQPLLSYYYCGSGSCIHDGLRFAVRAEGNWYVSNVHNVDNNRSGFWTSIAVDPNTGDPVIVFQDLSRGAAMVAYGTTSR